MNTPNTPPDDETTPEQRALGAALQRLLQPLARLAVARGVPFATVQQMLKQAFVDAAAAAHGTGPADRRVSRIAAATGINRREVTRLTRADAVPERAARGRSLASEAFAHWRAQPPYRDGRGRPRVLPRQGPAPSFETLAQAITRDMHPRSLLDELCRLGLAEVDEARDEVRLVRDAFVPSGDQSRLLGFLGDNVGDHLDAAVTNVLDGDRRHFEQAVFADGLSPASVAGLRPLIAAQWQALLAALVPYLEACVAADAAAAAEAEESQQAAGTPAAATARAAPAAPVPAAPAATARVRVGLYSFDDLGAAGPGPAATPVSPTPPRRRRRRPTGA